MIEADGLAAALGAGPVEGGDVGELGAGVTQDGVLTLGEGGKATA